MNKTQTTTGIHRLLYVLSLLLSTLGVLMIVSCAGEEASPPKPKDAVPGAPRSAKLQWADMLMGPGDSTQYDWVDGMGDWPDTQRVIADSTGRAHLGDLTFVFDTWIFKNKDLEKMQQPANCQLNIIVAGRNVPDHLLMKDFSIDSVLLFKPGDTTAAGRRLMFPARRKYLEGVWQVEFINSDDSDEKLDFPEGMRLRPHVYVSWQQKNLLFELPPSVYEYVESPTPSAD